MKNYNDEDFSRVKTLAEKRKSPYNEDQQGGKKKEPDWKNLRRRQDKRNNFQE